MSSISVRQGQVHRCIRVHAGLVPGPVGVVKLSTRPEPVEASGRGVEVTSSPPLEVFGVRQDREEVQLGGDEVPLGQVVNFDQMCAAVIATDVTGFEPGAAQDARAVVEQEATHCGVKPPGGAIGGTWCGGVPVGCCYVRWIRSSVPVRCCLPPISCWVVCCGVSC